MSLSEIDRFKQRRIKSRFKNLHIRRITIKIFKQRLNNYTHNTSRFMISESKHNGLILYSHNKKS